MKKTPLYKICIFLLLGYDSMAQTSFEFSVSSNYSISMKNEIVGSSLNYEDFQEGQSINLKSTSNNGVFFLFSNSFGNSNWRYFAGLDKRWLTYKTIIYPINLETQNLQNPKEIILKNQMNNLVLGMNKRFNLSNKKFMLELGVGVILRNYRDKQVQNVKNENFISENIKPNDYFYRVDIKFDRDQLKLHPFAKMEIGYSISPHYHVFLDFTKTRSFTTIYSLNKTDGSSSFSMDNIRIQSKFLNLGIGVIYSFD